MIGGCGERGASVRSAPRIRAKLTGQKHWAPDKHARPQTLPAEPQPVRGYTLNRGDCNIYLVEVSRSDDRMIAME
jgi:hypothetical protein